MPLKDPEALRRYLQANKEKIAARQRAYYAANRDRIREQANQHYLEIKEQKRTYDAEPGRKARRRHYSRAYRAENPQKTNEYNIKVKPKRADTEPSHIRNRERLAGRPRPDVCEICSKATKRIVFDHCHQHGHFRGWICERCNHALGMVQDSIPHLLQLIAYLQRNRDNSSPQLALSGI